MEDWIGLRSLDEAGRVQYISVPGNHLGISKKDMKKYVAPYLEDKKSPIGKKQAVLTKFEDGATAEPILAEERSSYELPLSIKSLCNELLTLVEEKLLTYY